MRSALAGWPATGSMWRLADSQHGSDQVVQRPGHVMLGDQDNLVIDAKMVDRPSRNRAAGRPVPVREVPPTGQCRWTRRCQPSGAAWCRPDRSGSRRPSSAQFVPSGRISAGRPRRWRPVGTPARSHALLTAGSETMHPQPSHERRRPRQSRREGLPRMTQRHEQPVADGQLNVKYRIGTIRLWARACPVDHETGCLSQIRIEATSTVPRQTKSRLSYLVATARC